MAGWRGGTFAAFQSRSFTILWSGAFLAFIAFFMSTAVQAVVAFDLAGNNKAVGFVILAQGISQLLLGPFGGALADRLSKRMVILACQSIITVAFLAAAILVATDTITVALLALSSFLIGLAFSFLGPARQGLLVEFVGPARRGNAIALSQVALNASRILAPFIAAAALGIGVIGAAGAFFIMTALYVAAMACTIALPATKPASANRPAVLGEIWSGIRYVARTPRIRVLVPSYILVIMCGFPYVSVLPGLVKNEFGRDASQITWLLTINAVGGLATSLAVASLADSRRAPAIYTGMCLVFGISLIVLGLMPSYWLLFLPMFVVGAAGGGFQTLNGALVSHLADPAYFGRVVSLTFLAFASSSVVALPVGSIADHFGEQPTIAASGVAVCALVIAFEVLGRMVDRRSAAPDAPHPVNAG
ncbi:MAG: MFS transporter [Dehalococcoidia bacterium]